MAVRGRMSEFDVGELMDMEDGDGAECDEPKAPEPMDEQAGTADGVQEVIEVTDVQRVDEPPSGEAAREGGRHHVERMRIGGGGEPDFFMNAEGLLFSSRAEAEAAAAAAAARRQRRRDSEYAALLAKIKETNAARDAAASTPSDS